MPPQTKLESIVAILDELVRLDSIGDVVRVIARGFIDIGALISILLVRDEGADGGEGRLRVVARAPEEQVDGLFRSVLGRSPLEFTIDLADGNNPYVRALRSGTPILIGGPDEVMDHIAKTYGAEPKKMAPVRAALRGKAGVVLPLVSGGERLGIAAINYADDLTSHDLHLFDIFAASAASMLRFKREVVGREHLLTALEAALDQERRTRAELNRAERLAALGEMAAVVAHEIRNPLAVIKNSLASLKRHLAPAPEAELLQRICGEETLRIERIIDDMLALAAPSGKRKHTVDLREILARAIFLAREQYENGDAKLQIHERLEGPLGRVEGDAHSLTQAFVNLLVNASESGNSGRIDVSAELTRTAEGSVVRVAIVDHGAGMDAATLSQVWEPFFTTKASGTGLGLSIVKRVIDAHGGRIDIASQPARGTTVTIELPAKED